MKLLVYSDRNYRLLNESMLLPFLESSVSLDNHKKFFSKEIAFFFFSIINVQNGGLTAA